MNINAALRRRSLGLSGRVEIDFAIDKLRLKEALKLTGPVQNEQDDQVLKTFGPLACAKLGEGIFAIANEDGHINLMRTRKLEEVSNWMAHENAVFDIKATPDNRFLLTASGDATIRKWDVETKKELTKIESHFSTVKSISLYNNHTLASGSRDGTIKIHDLRQKKHTTMIIRDAHRNYNLAKAPRKTSTKTDPTSCVTNVLFDPHVPRIYSTGANDATIKLWDIRKQPTKNRPRRTRDGQMLLHQPYIEVHHPSKGYHCGYSHILLHSGKLYAGCSDNKIYCYENFGSKSEPIKFAGYRYDTYLKLAVMEDRFLFSGGKGGGANVWNLGNKRSSKYLPETTKQPIGQLKLNDSDRFDTNVIETDWDSLSVFTFRDDRLVCKWTMHHVLDNERKSLIEGDALGTLQDDLSIQMSDIIDVNVLRPSHRVNMSQTNSISHF